jgi:hypothetical protein
MLMRHNVAQDRSGFGRAHSSGSGVCVRILGFSVGHAGVTAADTG